MSMTWRTNVYAADLEEFLLDEHVKGTGIPVHPFSVVNASMTAYNGTLGLSSPDGDGTLFVGDEELNAYGCGANNFGGMLKALARCGVETKFLW